MVPVLLVMVILPTVTPPAMTLMLVGPVRPVKVTLSPREKVVGPPAPLVVVQLVLVVFQLVLAAPVQVRLYASPLSTNRSCVALLVNL